MVDLDQIGRTGLMKIDAAINQALSAVIADKTQINPKYLLIWFNCNIDLWRNFAASSRKTNITKKMLKVFQ